MGLKRDRKGKETCVLIHFGSRREEGQGMTRKEGRAAVTEDAVVLVYTHYRWESKGKGQQQRLFCGKTATATYIAK